MVEEGRIEEVREITKSPRHNLLGDPREGLFVFVCLFVCFLFAHF